MRENLSDHPAGMSGDRLPVASVRRSPAAIPFYPATVTAGTYAPGSPVEKVMVRNFRGLGLRVDVRVESLHV